MGLLNENGAVRANKPAEQVASGSSAPESSGKKSGSYEYQKKIKAKIREGASRILNNPAVKAALTAEDKAYLEWLNREPSVGGNTGNFGTPILNKLFGDKPAVGAKVTLQEVFDKTVKGKAQMDSLMKKWKEKQGVDIEFVFNKDKPAQSTYTIKSIA